MIKQYIKTLLGKVRAKRFHIKYGKDIYIGKHCSFKGHEKIMLEDDVTVRPYTQIWSGGVPL